MINVQYASHQPGPTLKDVKARLIALRGKGMPDSFSWSYKRSYKDTFIWCDLFDDDFILPLSGTGEYVLKAMELFDALQDDDNIECEEPQLAKESMPIRSSRDISPMKPSKPSTKEEYLHVESNFPVAMKKSLMPISDADDATSDNSKNLNNQTKKNLAHSKRATEVCSLDYSDASSNRMHPSCEDGVENEKYVERQRQQNDVARTERGAAAKECNLSSRTVRRELLLQGDVYDKDTSSISGNVGEDKDHLPRNGTKSVASMIEKSSVAKQCNAGSQTPFRESSLHKDAATDRKELIDSSTATPIMKDNMSVFSPSPAVSSVPKRRMWEKEIDKSTIYTELIHSKSSDDEQRIPRMEVHDIITETSSPCLSAPEDPFLYGVLRKATRLGSFRPRMCRGIDVVDSTRARTKMPFRSKARDESNKVSKSPGKNTGFLVDESPKSINSCPEASEKQNTHTSSDQPTMEYMTLLQYFESGERPSPVPKLMSEAPSAEDSSKQQLSFVQAAPQPLGTAALVTDLPEIDPLLPELRSFGNNALDLSYRETMEALAKLPARGVCRMRTIPQVSEVPEPVTRPVPRRDEHKVMSGSKGDKQEAKLDSKSPTASTPPSRQAPKSRVEPDTPSPGSMHNTHGRTTGKTQEEPPNSVTSKQRRPNAKKCSETSISRNLSKESSPKRHDEQFHTVEESTISRVSDSSTFDSRTSHAGSGNNQGLKRTTQRATEAADKASLKSSLNEGSKGWPFEHPSRPKDFKSREDRLLTPGLTQMDWEKSLQEAVMKSEPPVDMVLHECLQCGRTFKLESLQVHMRGCHAINKPKSLSTQRRRVSQ